MPAVIVPVSFRQGDRDQIAYELHVTNFQRTDAVLTGVRVDSNRGPLIEHRADELHHRITRPGLRNDHPDPPVLGPGMRAVLNFWIPLRDAAIVPSSISHVVELTVTRPTSSRCLRTARSPVIRKPGPRPATAGAPMCSRSLTGSSSQRSTVCQMICRSRFAFYQHLQRGSVRVKQGQRVRRGDVLAKLGSSGSSSIGPHLHFHVVDANQTLAAEGLPFVFRNFTGLGEFSSIAALLAGDKWIPGQLARPAGQTRPTPNAVISFP